MRGIKDMIGLCCWLNNEHGELMEKVLSKAPSPNQDRLRKLEELDLRPGATHGLTERTGPSAPHVAKADR